MSALTSRSPSRPRSARSRLMTEETENMDRHVNDWKLGPNVQLKVVMKKLELQNMKHFQTSPKMLEVKSKSKSNVQKRPVRKSPLNDKNFVEALRDLLPRCDPNCYHCEQYISKLSEHIQSAHEPQENEQRVFDSLISFNGQETEAGTNFDLDIDPSLALTQDSESQSRTLIIRHTKVIHYVEEIDQNLLGQLSMTTEGQVTNTSTTFQNCLSESSEFEAMHVEEVEVQYNSDEAQIFENLSELNENPESDPLTANLASTDIGNHDDSDTGNLDNDNDGDPSDPDYEDKNDTDSEFEESFVKIENENFEEIQEIENEKCERNKENLDVVLRVDTVKTVKDIHTGQNIKIRILTAEADQEMTEDVSQEIFKKIQTTKNLKSKIYTGEKHYGCEFCGKIFKRKMYLTKHRKLFHTGEIKRVRKKIYNCETCGKSYISRALLIIHKRSHTGEKPFMCEVCGACLNSATNLQGHMLIHQEKSIICDHCGLAFPARSYLHSHVKIHTRENPYKCEDCDESFFYQKQLEFHKKVHTGGKVYKCDCGKYFRDMNQLTSHKRHHKEERKFKCSVCPKSFKFKSHLNTHFKIHIGIKAHKCEKCEKSFILPSELKSHRKKNPNCKPQVKVCDPESVLSEPENENIF